tara:strand:- start:1081 stop:1572 length:492 start_codon:yes stop_codon:yes gene_type:complete
MDELYYPNLPETNNILNPPRTIFYPPVVEEPFLDPLLLPSLEQVQSGLEEEKEDTSEEEKEQSEEVTGIKQEEIPLNLPKNLENTSNVETIGTFNVPFFGDFPIPAPEVIASSVVAAGTASVVTVAGGIAAQAVVTQLKKIFKKIITKVLKKEVSSLKKKSED